NRVLSASSVRIKLRAVGLISAVIGLPLLVALVVPLSELFLLKHNAYAVGVDLPRALALTHNTIYGITAVFFLGVAYYRRDAYGFSMAHVKGLSYLTGLGAVLNLILQGVVIFYSALSLGRGLSLASKLNVLGSALRSHTVECLPLFLLMIAANGFRQF